MLYKEIIAVCTQIHTKHINTPCGQNVELLKVMYSNHWAFPKRHHAWIPSCSAARHTRITTQQFVNILHALQIDTAAHKQPVPLWLRYKTACGRSSLVQHSPNNSSYYFHHLHKNTSYKRPWTEYYLQTPNPVTELRTLATNSTNTYGPTPTLSGHWEHNATATRTNTATTRH